MPRFEGYDRITRRHALYLLRSGRWSIAQVALIIDVSTPTAWRWAREAGLDPARATQIQIIAARELYLRIKEGTAPQPRASRRAMRAEITQAEANTDPAHLAAITRKKKRRPAT
jgi:hypothetical protein